MPTSGTIGEVKDIVRAHFGLTQFPTSMLDQALAEGRRIIENHGNFWWMRGRKDFSLTVGTNEYSVTSSVSPGLGLTNFKDGKAITWALVGGTRFEPAEYGTIEEDEVEIIYDTDNEGSPEIVILKDETLHFYPPEPDAAYQVRFYYWTYTVNPQLNTATDVLTKRFPMALAYAGIIWGYEMVVKDFQAASYFRSLLGGVPFGRSGELAKIKSENFKRGWQDKVDFTPRLGPGIRFRRRLENTQIYR